MTVVTTETRQELVGCHVLPPFLCLLSVPPNHLEWKAGCSQAVHLQSIARSYWKIEWALHYGFMQRSKALHLGTHCEWEIEAGAGQTDSGAMTTVAWYQATSLNNVSAMNTRKLSIWLDSDLHPHRILCKFTWFLCQGDVSCHFWNSTQIPSILKLSKLYTQALKW